MKPLKIVEYAIQKRRQGLSVREIKVLVDWRFKTAVASSTIGEWVKNIEVGQGIENGRQAKTASI